MDRSKKSRLKTSFWYREGYKEGAWNGFLACLSTWAVLSGAIAIFSFWFKEIPSAAWPLWTFPLWFAAVIWLYFKWLDWRHPVTK